MSTKKPNPVESLSDDELVHTFQVFLTEDIDSRDDATLDLLQAELKKRGLDPFEKIEEEK